MEEFEIIKLARSIEFSINRIYVDETFNGDLQCGDIKDLQNIGSDAETVVSWISCNKSYTALNIMGKEGILYIRLGRISERYDFDDITKKEILRGMQALLRANYILYEEKEENKSVTFTSKIHFTTKKGEKTDFIRIINGMYELGFFSKENGTKIPKRCIFEEFGKLVNIDLADYQNLLSKANKGSNNDGNSQKYAIFDRLKEASIKKENK